MRCFTITGVAPKNQKVKPFIRVTPGGRRYHAQFINYPTIFCGDKYGPSHWIPVGTRDFGSQPDEISEASIITTRKGGKLLVAERGEDRFNALVKASACFVTTGHSVKYPCPGRGRGVPLYAMQHEFGICDNCGTAIPPGKNHPDSGEVDSWTVLENGHGEPHGVRIICSGNPCEVTDDCLLVMEPCSKIRLAIGPYETGDIFIWDGADMVRQT